MAEKQDPLAGQRIRDYLLVRLLGKGAMGMVYLARHIQTNEEVAVKFLSGEFSDQSEFVTRFFNEAESCKSLKHENIIGVREAGEDEGVYFMVMEYVNGVDLSHYLEVQHKVKEAQALPWLKSAAIALDYAHSHGIIHRDLKPENIMISREGIVKIADLGLSKNMEMQDASMTLSGTVIGTPFYISPEQARNAKHVDPRTDVYALGATFYHLLTGVPPFTGDSSAEVMSKHMHEPLVSPQRKNFTLSDGFSDLIIKMMEKAPANRFQSMTELLEAISRFEKGEQVVKNKVKLQHHGEEVEFEKPKQKTALFSSKLIVMVLMCCAILGGSFFLWHILTPNSEPQKSLPDNGTASKEQVTLNFHTKGTKTAVSKEPLPVQKKAEATIDSNIERSAPIQSNEEGLNLSGSASTVRPSRSFSLSFGSLNWMDGLCLPAILIGVYLVRQVGLIWGLVRVISFWVAIFGICSWFGSVGGWIRGTFSCPEPLANCMAFIFLSLIFLLLALAATDRLQGHYKLTWRRDLTQMLAIVPGIVLGGAFAVWIFAAIAVIAGDALPIENSWVGSQVVRKFPTVEIASKRSGPLLDMRDKNYYAPAKK